MRLAPRSLLVAAGLLAHAAPALAQPGLRAAASGDDPDLRRALRALEDAGLREGVEARLRGILNSSGGRKSLEELRDLLQAARDAGEDRAAVRALQGELAMSMPGFEEAAMAEKPSSGNLSSILDDPYFNVLVQAGVLETTEMFGFSPDDYEDCVDCCGDQGPFECRCACVVETGLNLPASQQIFCPAVGPLVDLFAPPPLDAAFAAAGTAIAIVLSIIESILFDDGDVDVDGGVGDEFTAIPYSPITKACYDKIAPGSEDDGPVRRLEGPQAINDLVENSPSP